MAGTHSKHLTFIIYSFLERSVCVLIYLSEGRATEREGEREQCFTVHCLIPAKCRSDQSQQLGTPSGSQARNEALGTFLLVTFSVPLAGSCSRSRAAKTPQCYTTGYWCCKCWICYIIMPVP